MLTKYEPKIKYELKMIHISKIVGEEKTVQARLGGIDSKKVDELELAIEAVGLKDPIEVEELESDAAFPDDDTFTLREGSHRNSAWARLYNKHGEEYEFIKCKVYEKNTSAASEHEWLVWQIDKNRHADKVCTPNSNDDITNMLSSLLMHGQIGSKSATKAAQMNKWNDPNTEKALDDYIAASPTFKGMRSTRRQAIKEKVWDFHGQIYLQKIKRYDNQSDIKTIVQNNFNCLKPNTKSQCGKYFVRCASNDDYHAAINTLMADTIRETNAPAENVLLFHCKKKDANVIDTKRKKCLKMVKDANARISKCVKGYGKKKAIPHVYFLGQKIEQGEKADKLMKQRL